MRIRKSSEARRGEILAAAEALFRARGYAEVQVHDILEACDLSRGGFYHHFGSKAAVLEQLVRDETGHLAHATEAAGPASLTVLLRGGSGYLGPRGGVFDTLGEEEDVALYLGFLEQAQDELLRPVLERAIVADPACDPEAPVDPRHVAELFLAVNAHINRKVLGGAWSDPEAIAFSRVALRALGALLGDTERFGALGDAMVSTPAHGDEP